MFIALYGTFPFRLQIYHSILTDNRWHDLNRWLSNDTRFPKFAKKRIVCINLPLLKVYPSYSGFLCYIIFLCILNQKDVLNIIICCFNFQEITKPPHKWTFLCTNEHQKKLQWIEYLINTKPKDVCILFKNRELICHNYKDDIFFIL